MKKKYQLLFLFSTFLFLLFFPAKTEAKSNLETRKRAAVNEIYQCLMSFDTYVDISKYKIPYSEKMATSLFDEALEKDLYLFNILANISDFSNDDGFCSCYTNGKYFAAFEFDYKNYKQKALQKQYRLLKKKIDVIWQELRLDELSEEWAIVAVHDYIALHTDYDYARKPKRKSYTAYGALIDGKAVCSGYSTACELLLSELEIPTKIVTSNDMDHAWNIVKLKGRWYHMDITWDDPYVDRKDYVSYRYFLQTDTEFKNNKKTPHYGWSTKIKCNSTKYSRIPRTDNRTLLHMNGSWYQLYTTKKGVQLYQRYNFSFTKKLQMKMSFSLFALFLNANLNI